MRPLMWPHVYHGVDNVIFFTSFILLLLFESSLQIIYNICVDAMHLITWNMLFMHNITYLHIYIFYFRNRSFQEQQYKFITYIWINLKKLSYKSIVIRLIMLFSCGLLVQ